MSIKDEKIRNIVKKMAARKKNQQENWSSKKTDSNIRNRRIMEGLGDSSADKGTVTKKEKLCSVPGTHTMVGKTPVNSLLTSTGKQAHACRHNFPTPLPAIYNKTS